MVPNLCNIFPAFGELVYSRPCSQDSDECNWHRISTYVFKNRFVSNIPYKIDV